MRRDDASGPHRRPGRLATGPVAAPGAGRPDPALPDKVGVVGSGLIGTSIGLALSAVGVDVLLRDMDSEQVKVAEAMGAGRPWVAERVEHAIVAVPPHAVAGELRALQQARLAGTFSDVASVKARPIIEAVQAGCDLTTWCPGHPVAGRERGGAISARADLFAERTWVFCPLPHTSHAALAAAVAVATACGAIPVTISAERHDTAMAALSHVPQVVASTLAAATSELRPGELALAGQGFRDATRIADSDPHLWASILEGNRAPVVAALRRMVAELSHLADTFETAAEEPTLARVRELIGRGNAGRARLPGKAGAPGRTWSWVSVVLDDRPGQLGALFTAIGRWEFNVEDVGPFEHSLDAPAGIVEVAVDQDAADDLVGRLTAGGWTAYRRS